MHVPRSFFALASCIAVSAAGAQSAPPEGASSIRPFAVEAGLGLLGTPPSSSAGYEAGLFVSTRPGQLAMVRYLNVEQFCLFNCFRPDRLSEFGAMYGWESHSRWTGAMVASGVSAVTTLVKNRNVVDEPRERRQNLGVPVELRFSLFPAPWLGISLTGVGGMNHRQPFAGGFLAVQLGHY